MALNEFQPNTKLNLNKINNNFSSLADGTEMHYNQEWTTYTPAWRAITTDPVIEDGTLNGRYMRMGTMIICRITMRAGASTTFGTGAWEFQLPTRVSTEDYVDTSPLDGSGSAIGNVYIENNAVVGHSGHLRLMYGTQWVRPSALVVSGTFATYSDITSAVPFAWGDDDYLTMTIVYEAQDLIT